MNTQALRKKSYKTILALAGAAIIAAMPVAAEADPISVLPDITSAIYYWDATTFTGFNTSLTDGGGSHSGYGDFSVAGASVEIGGSFDGYPSVEIFGHISDVLVDTGNEYTFLFDIDLTTSSNLFGAKGKTTILKYIGEDPYGNNYTYGTADTVAAAPVPEPATISLMLMGGSALVGLRRRRVADAA